MEHYLVPPHKILDEEEAAKVLMHYKIDRSKLPKVKRGDAALPKNAKIGDIIKIDRESRTAGETIYYRVVVE